MSTRITLELTDEQVQRLDRATQHENLPRAEAVAHLLELAIRQAEFPSIEFKDFGAGLEPFIVGTRLRVCRILSLARDYDGDVEKVAVHVDVPKHQIESALRYATAFPDEVERDLARNEMSYEEMKRILPNLKQLPADARVNASAP
jgi:uncharacterized protein (DUF433 family)